MKEYFGKTSQVYQQTDGKRLILIPAFYRNIPNALKSDQKLLDVACGHGDFYELAKEKGYTYYGLDISKDMIDEAKRNFPDGRYLVSSAISFSRKYNERFVKYPEI